MTEIFSSSCSLFCNRQIFISTRIIQEDAFSFLFFLFSIWATPGSAHGLFLAPGSLLVGSGDHIECGGWNLGHHRQAKCPSHSAITMAPRRHIFSTSELKPAWLQGSLILWHFMVRLGHLNPVSVQPRVIPRQWGQLSPCVLLSPLEGRAHLGRDPRCFVTDQRNWL